MRLISASPSSSMRGWARVIRACSASVRCSNAGGRIRTSTGTLSPTASGLLRMRGAKLICLQELTLSPYFAATDEGPRSGCRPEPLVGDPTTV